MTAIAYDGKTLAAERQVTAGEVIVGYRKKIFKWSKGVYAIAGAETSLPLVEEFLEKGSDWEPEKGEIDCIFTKDGTVYYMNHKLVPEVCYVPWALGVYDRQMEALMKVGFSAKDVVKEACKWSLGCGGKVDVVEV